MTKGEIKEISVIIEKKDEKVYAVFNFEEKLKIELTSGEGSYLKNFFINLMQELNKENFILSFPSEEDELYSNVIRKYVEHLNAEIIAIREEFLKHKTEDEHKTSSDELL